MSDRQGCSWLAGLALLLVLPFFVVDVPPVLDYPNHLARLTLLARMGTDPVLAAMYEPQWRILPNLAVDLAGQWLVQILPVHAAGRLLLAGSLLLPVIGAAAYGRAVFGSFSFWTLGAGIVGYSGLFFLGFMNFLYGVGLALLGAALWLRLRKRNPWLAAAAGAGFAALIFFCHLFGVLFFALLVGAREAAELWGGRRLAPAAIGLAALRLGMILAPAALLYFLSPLGGTALDAAYDEPVRKLIGLFTPFMTYHAAFGAMIGLAVYALAILGWRRGRVDPGSLLAMSGLAAAYVLAPLALKSGTFVYYRLAVMMGLLLFAGYRPGFGRRPAWLAGVLAGLVAARVLEVGLVWAGHNADLADFRRVIAPVEPGARVLVVDAAPAGSAERAEPKSRSIPTLYRTDLHLPALLVIERRAFWPFLFADPRQQPIAVRPPYDHIAAPLREPPDAGVLQAAEPPASAPYLRDWQRSYDYVLLLHAGALAAPERFEAERLRFLGGADIAALFAVRR